MRIERLDDHAEQQRVRQGATDRAAVWGEWSDGGILPATPTGPTHIYHYSVFLYIIIQCSYIIVQCSYITIQYSCNIIQCSYFTIQCSHVHCILLPAVRMGPAYTHHSSVF